MNSLAVQGGDVWIGGEEVIRNGVILVTGGKITAVGSRASVQIPSNVTVVDAQGTTVLPGLIDCHVHLSTNSDQSVIAATPDYLAWTPPGVKVLHAVRNAQRALASGFTTLRAMGLPDGGEVHLKDFAARGLMPLPRVHLAPWWISMTGGHGDMFYPPHFERGPWHTADGVVEVRRSVRKQLSLGADFIKIMASGGALSHGDDPDWSNYTTEEIAAAAHEAHTYGLTVASHAHSWEGINRSLDAGVDSIEHGTSLDEEQAHRMGEAGTFLVPTLEIGEHTLATADSSGVGADLIEKLRAGSAGSAEAFRLAHASGVKIAMGTDSAAAFAPFGNHARELELYVELGMTPVEALTSATASAAELLHRDDLGVIAVGASADLVCVEGDPLSDIYQLRRPGGVRVVVKDGRVVELAHSSLYPEVGDA